MMSTQSGQVLPVPTGQCKRGNEEVEGPDHPPGSRQATILQHVHALLTGPVLGVRVRRSRDQGDWFQLLSLPIGAVKYRVESK